MKKTLRRCTNYYRGVRYIKRFILVLILFINIPVFASGKNLSTADKTELLTLIKCCADIDNYDRNDYDMDELMRKVLYTHRNFRLLSSIPANEQTINSSLKMCSERFISDSIQKAFRLQAKHPEEYELADIGYCSANGYYYYYGGYTRYFATDVHRISNTFYTSDGSLYVIFSNSFNNGTSLKDEYSTATAKRDGYGWYLTSIHMNSDFTDMPEYLTTVSAPLLQDPGSHSYLTLLIILIAAALVTIIIVRVYIL